MGDLELAKTKRESVIKKYTTGKGELTGFIGVFEPSTKFNKEGVYSANILLPQEEGEKLAAEIKNIRTEQFKTYGKKTKVTDLTRCVPYGIVDEETGEETPDAQGRYILKTTAKAFIENGKPKVKIPVFDAKQNPVQDVRIGAGTIARLSISLEGYSVAGKTGVSVKLKALQIIDLVEYGNGSAESYGFGDEDGSFEFSEDDAEEETTTDVEEDEDDEEADF